MAPPSSSDPGVQELVELQREANRIARARSGGDTSSISAFSGALGPAGKAATEFGKGLFDISGKVLGGVGTAFGAIKDQLYNSLDVWRDLSDKGAGFQNDVVGMSVAAAGAREDLRDFAKQIKENTIAMMGLGGTPGAGAVLFGKALRDLYDHSNSYVDTLQKMGYQNEQLNELMALQISYQHGLTGTKNGQSDAVEAMNSLATQMDLTARMTGESRKEQQEQAKLALSDAKVEMKFRLIGLKEGKDAEKKARETFAEQYTKAEAQGAGQMFKEYFYAGRAITQTAANQQVLSGGAGEKFKEQAQATARGDKDAADAAFREARDKNIANFNDASKLQIGIMSAQGSAFGEAFNARLMKNNNQDAAIKSIQNEEGGKFKDYASAAMEQERRAKLEAAGFDKDGKKLIGSGITDALVQGQQRAKDVNAALMENLVTPLKEKISPTLGTFAEKLLGATMALPDGRRMAVSPALGTAFNAGLNNTGTTAPMGRGGQPVYGTNPILQGAYGLGTGMRVGGQGANWLDQALGISSGINSAIGPITPEAEPIRDLGTKGMIGKDKEPKDTIVKISKDERVLSPEETAAYNAKQNNSVESIFKNLQISGVQGDKIQEQVMSFFGPLLNQVKGMGDAVVSQTAEPVEATPKQETTQSAQQDTPGKELAGLLVELNKSMAIVAKFAAETADNTKKTVSATQGLSNNRLR